MENLLYEILLEKESKARKELKVIFDEYNIPSKVRCRIMTFSRKISTLKNLKKDAK